MPWYEKRRADRMVVEWCSCETGEQATMKQKTDRISSNWNYDAHTTHSYAFYCLTHASCPIIECSMLTCAARVLTHAKALSLPFLCVIKYARAAPSVCWRRRSTMSMCLRPSRADAFSSGLSEINLIRAAARANKMPWHRTNGNIITFAICMFFTPIFHLIFICALHSVGSVVLYAFTCSLA